jgi:hypothetical protein
MKRRRKILAISCVLAILSAGDPRALLLLGQETPRYRSRPGSTGDAASCRPGSSTRPAAAPPATRPGPPIEQSAAGRAVPHPPRGPTGTGGSARTSNGVWWFVSPAGDAEFLNTVTTVQPTLLGRQRDAADYVSADWNPDHKTEAELDRWAQGHARPRQGRRVQGRRRVVPPDPAPARRADHPRPERLDVAPRAVEPALLARLGGERRGDDQRPRSSRSATTATSSATTRTTSWTGATRPSAPARTSTSCPRTTRTGPA